MCACVCVCLSFVVILGDNFERYHGKFLWDVCLSIYQYHHAVNWKLKRVHEKCWTNWVIYATRSGTDMYAAQFVYITRIPKSKLRKTTHTCRASLFRQWKAKSKNSKVKLFNNKSAMEKKLRKLLLKYSHVITFH